MNISENISRINQAKSDIKNVIIAKGGSVADDDKIDTYAKAIEALPSGGGDDGTVKGIIDRTITKCDIPQGTTSIGKRAFESCTSLTSVTIPDSVTSIGSYAFNQCSGLTSVTIPDSVTSIDTYALYYCQSLTTVTIKASTPPTVTRYPLNGKIVTAIYVPSGSVDTYKSASGWSGFADKIQPIQE